ncbi:MAG: alpha/beta hydrolase [Spirochaetaceae bacterium]|jgi:acetyl esterase/lipase|nr:alpha/beta hydrolase [Spirochaetaceae bacterium]
MRKIIISFFIVCGLCALAGCVSTGNTPQDIRYTLHKDLSYGAYERNLVDISIPHTAPQGVILFIHGGIWMYGDKSNCPIFLDTFRDRFVTASMSHRYLDETTHMQDLEGDVAAAVSFIRDFCAEQNIDPGKLILMGHSSGAHLAMLYAYKQHEPALPIAFCVNMAGPADLADTAFLYNFKKLRWEKLFYELAEKATGHHIETGDITSEGYSESSLKILEAISPIYFVTAESPPTIIAHDAADRLVPYANSTALNSVFNVYGIDHEFIALYSGIGHFLGAKLVKGGALLYDKPLEERIIRAMNEYIEKYCGHPPKKQENESR